MENNHNNKNNNNMKRIALIGGGPCSLFMYKRLVQSHHCHLSITIFEADNHLGQGMPYSTNGANDEHVTNVSGNEIPDLVSSLSDWVTNSAPQSLLDRLHVNIACFHEYKVVPRLLFGAYLEAQYQLLIEQGDKQGLKTTVHLRTSVVDISYQKERVLVKTAKNLVSEFDYVIIATGHVWPKKHEGEVPGYFDSPYPPAKLEFKANHPVAIIGSSLTAIDAIRTLARHNGTFEEDHTSGLLTFKPSDESPEFRIIIHTRHGLLPVVRIHLADSHLTAESTLSPEQISDNRAKNGGFLSLDYVFEKNFKDLFITKDPKFYETIRNMSMEEFVGAMMNFREKLEPFLLLKLEYAEAEKSIQRHESVIWKEMLAILSFAMNYPAKYFSAEDMLRLQKELMPLIAIVIAFIPQSSCKELMALHEAGKLDIIGVGFDSSVHVDEEKHIVYKYGKDAQHKEVEFKTYVDAIGQKHMAYEDFPFKSLMEEEVISTAKILFHDNEAGKQARENGNKNVHENENGKYYLLVPGITINDYYQLVDESGASNEQIYNMAVPHMGGYNPDYSGLDFCEAASQVIADRIFEYKKGMTKDGLGVAH